jgi:LPXTG-motif cell wall-anchored protein
MTWATLYLVFFLLAALAALGGLFLFGWKRRNDKTPKVAPLPRDDDWD